jgi:hypothetical protein
MRLLLLLGLLTLPAFAQKSAPPTAGTYDTKVELLKESSTCPETQVRDNPTTFSDVTGTNFTLSHSGISYSATGEKGAFKTEKKTLKFGTVTYTLEIEGTYDEDAFKATVTVTETKGEKSCGYSVKWAGTLREQPVLTQPLHRRPDYLIRFQRSRYTNLQEVGAQRLGPAIFAPVESDDLQFASHELFAERAILSRGELA